MKRYKTFKYSLRPTKAQRRAISAFCDKADELFNQLKEYAAFVCSLGLSFEEAKEEIRRCRKRYVTTPVLHFKDGWTIPFFPIGNR